MKENANLKMDITRARYNLLFFILLSLLNIYFLVSNDIAYIPYSSFISLFAIGMGNTAGVPFIGYFISAIVFIILFVCFCFSKKSPFFLYVAFSVVSADTLLLTVVMIIDNTIGNLSIFNILLHLLNLLYIFVAIKAFKKLENQTDSQGKAESEENDESEDIIVTEYVDDGTEPLLKGSINGLSVFVVIRHAKAELVANGYTCDALDITHNSEFELCAEVNGIELYFQYRRAFDGTSAFLYANETLLDSLVLE